MPHDSKGRRLAFAAAIGAIAAIGLSACATPRPAGVVAVASSHQVTSHQAGSGIPPAIRHRLLAIAEQAAQADGAKPDWISVVATTHAKALAWATPGDFSGDANEAVYLITIKGSFTANDVSHPAGVKAPTGTYISLVLDAKTLRGTDFGLSKTPPPVPPSALGPVTYLKG